MDNNNFYAPSGNVKDTNRTYVPDLYSQIAAEMNDETDGSVPPEYRAGQMLRLQRRQLVGVLYSISAGIDGELFPVYVGRNSVGSDIGNDICLRESSVSQSHALLLTRKQTDETGREFVGVQLADNYSTCGTSVNGERLYDRVACHDGDIIGIGHHYELVLSLFGALDRLSVSRDFDRLPEAQIMPDLKPQPTLVSGQAATPPLDPPAPAAETPEPDKDAGTDGADFYRPSKQSSQDHYNNKTIIL